MNNLDTHGVVIVLKQRDTILLLKESRKLMRDCWAPPHGRFKRSDVLEENTVIREAFEETHLNVKPQKKLWTTTADTKIKTVSFWLATIVDGDIKLNLENSTYGWFTIDEALELQLYPGTKDFLQLVLSNKIVL